MSSESRRRAKAAIFDDGNTADAQFESALGIVLSVSKEEMERREAEYQEARAGKDRPGPRPGRNYRQKTA